MRSSPYQWSEDLVTGVADIDLQHRTLIDIMADTDQKLLLGMDRAELDTITRELLAYAIYHFDTEERLIIESGFNSSDPQAAAFHIQEHRGFMARVIALRDNGSAGEEILTLLNDWLINHILTTDMRLGKFLTGK